ncbi:LysR family transcriptional regulator [Photobacterium alginatilyticum]|uniref:LysR family transcriptional regulator n=1 Tax=Photobacterium alginatilyticum TaxID=1775171 RepID=A0ABW9YBK4_9GAMM|nr:LysR family transcriptional regulator [Photobacterium alginatilyticum]NBI51165.1 LysR family transcriptional regulator [Photobacterium alginatilyticum]
MDQLGAMRAFIRVVQTGSFSAAAREKNTTQATISKKVAALETMLGVKLLTRSSRELSLTQVGAEYYEKCVSIIGELDEAEASARSQVASPKGIIRITAPVVFGRLVIAPILSEFLSLYPEIKVDLALSDKHVDLISEGVDVAIRARELEDSSLIARHLFDNPMLLVAAPEYLAQHGEPKEPTELRRHNCLVYSMLKTVNIWHFFHQDKNISVAVNGNFQGDNGDVILKLVLDGTGLAQLPVWMVDEHLKSGELKQILSDFVAKPLPFNAIYPQSRYVPLKVRCFVDFLKQKLSDKTLYQ